MTQVTDVSGATTPEVITGDSRTQFAAYLESQPGFVQALHTLFSGLMWVTLALAAIMWIFGLVVTIRWAITGDPAGLANGWLSYGFSMSLLVLPMGLDTMLLRAHPTFIMPFSWKGDAQNQPKFRTGLRAFLTGVAITFGGLPGLVYWIQVLTGGFLA